MIDALCEAAPTQVNAGGERLKEMPKCLGLVVVVVVVVVVVIIVVVVVGFSSMFWWGGGAGGFPNTDTFLFGSFLKNWERMRYENNLGYNDIIHCGSKT